VTESAILSPYAVGVVGVVVGLIPAFVMWSLSRNVKHEDESKAKLRLDHDALAKDVLKLREESNKSISELQRLITDARHSSELQHRDVTSAVAGLTAAVGELKGIIGSLGATVEANRDKMSAFYKVELEKLEARMDAKLAALSRKTRTR
jgi:hypothetical protein